VIIFSNIVNIISIDSLMNPATKKAGIVFLKATIAMVCIAFIYRKVMLRDGFEQYETLLTRSFENPAKLQHLVLVMILMFCNWFIETMKWKLLLSSITRVGWLRCFRSVLSGVTVSIFTPNRIGEFAGRILHLEPSVRIKAVIASIIGSMNQLLVTIVAGGCGLMASLYLYVDDEIVWRALISIIILTILSCIYIYFRIPALTRIAEKIRVLKKINLYTSIFAKYSPVSLIKLSFLSALRYCVFLIQFIIMLYWFDVYIPWQEAIKAISLMYLVLAVVPSLAISELTVRGSVALFFFAAYTANSSGILAATSMIWLINLVIPAVLGALAAFYFRLSK